MARAWSYDSVPLWDVWGGGGHMILFPLGNLWDRVWGYGLVVWF